MQMVPLLSLAASALTGYGHALHGSIASKNIVPSEQSNDKPVVMLQCGVCRVAELADSAGD